MGGTGNIRSVLYNKYVYTSIKKLYFVIIYNITKINTIRVLTNQSHTDEAEFKLPAHHKH